MVFQIISEKIPAKRLNQVTSVAVLGCSFGAAITPFALSTIGIHLREQCFYFFTVLGIAMALLAFSLLYLFKRSAGLNTKDWTKIQSFSVLITRKLGSLHFVIYTFLSHQLLYDSRIRQYFHLP